MHTESLTLPGADGHALAASLELPADLTPRAYALFAHCFTCTRNIRAAVHIARALAERGIATLRFDFTGLGESEGEFADTTFSTNVDDIVAAARFLDREYDAPALLVGHSLGGAAVLQAAARIPSARAVATVGAPCEPGHVVEHFADRLDAIRREGQATVRLAGRPFTIRREFVEDLERTRMREVIAALGRPLLVLHAPDDDTVPMENAEHIFASARAPRSLVSLDGADHLLTRPDDARYVGALVAAWAQRYLPRDEDPATPAEPGWTVVSTGASGYTSYVATSRHRLVADEPVSVGGADLGPSPYELLGAALGACTGITLRMYADHKGWPLAGVTVSVHHERIHARDCETCETSEGRIDRFTRRIRLAGPLDAPQRARLLEIADRCPVHRTLRGEVDVVTEEDTREERS